MIRVNFEDGRTDLFDLEIDPETWRSLERDRVKQKSIRAASVANDRLSTVVPLPTGFRQVIYSGEVVGNKAGRPVADRLIVQADDVRLDVVVYRGSQLIRVDLRRSGQPRYLAQFNGRK